MLRKVVFPEPDGPMTETNSPSPTVSDNPSSACVSTRSVRYTFLMPFICSIRCPPSLQNDCSRAAEGRGIARDDALPFVQPADDFDFRDAGRAGDDVAFVGALAVDDPRAPPAAALQPRAARRLEDVVLRLEDEARGEALALLHARRPPAVRHRPRRDLVADDLGRDGGDVPRLLLHAERDGDGRSDFRVARVLLGDGELELERGEVDDVEDGLIGGDAVAVVDGERGDHAVERRADGEVLEFLLQLRGRRFLTAGLQRARADVEAAGLFAERDFAHGLLELELGDVDVVLRLLEVAVVEQSFLV